MLVSTLVPKPRGISIKVREAVTLNLGLLPVSHPSIGQTSWPPARKEASLKKRLENISPGNMVKVQLEPASTVPTVLIMWWFRYSY